MFIHRFCDIFTNKRSLRCLGFDRFVSGFLYFSNRSKLCFIVFYISCIAVIFFILMFFYFLCWCVLSVWSVPIITLLLAVDSRSVLPILVLLLIIAATLLLSILFGRARVITGIIIIMWWLLSIFWLRLCIDCSMVGIEFHDIVEII